MQRQLSSLPQQDKIQFIRSFVKAQKSFSRSHAEEGRVHVESWDSAKPPTAPTRTLVEPIGFGTPVLKPRVAMQVNNTRVKATDLSKESTKENKMPPRMEKIVRGVPKTSLKSKARSSPKKSKRKLKVYSDDEHADRLAERRSRKKAKKDRMNPQKQDDDSDSTGNVTEAQLRKRAKVPASLALLHGFSATNVGKNRLTSRLPVSSGVFNKGKSSRKTATEHAKKSSSAANIFSEFAFLNQARLDQLKPKLEGNHPTKYHTESESECESILESVADQKVQTKKRKNRVSLQDPSAVESILSGDDEDGRSRVWDIERDSFVLPSRVSSMVKPSTIILDTQPLLRSNKQNASPKIPATDKSGDVRSCIPSSPSITPSQSASQLFNKPTRLPVPTQSKYFPTAPVRSSIKTPAASEVSEHPDKQSVHGPTLRISTSPTSDHQDSNQFICEPPSFYDSKDTSHDSHPSFIPHFTERTVPQYTTNSYSKAYDHDDSHHWTQPIFDNAPIYSDIPEIEELHPIHSPPMQVACYDMEYADHDEVLAMNLDEDFTDMLTEDPNIDDIHCDQPYDDAYCANDITEEYALENQDQRSDIYDEDDCFGIGADYEGCPEEAVYDIPVFTEGQQLLRGLAPATSGSLSRAETDVAKNLKGHWYPQRLD